MNRVHSVLVLVANLLVLVTTSVAWSQVPFRTELGFKQLKDLSAPSFIKQASVSVFEVRSLSEDKVEDLTVLDLTDPKFSDIEGKIDGIATLDDKEKFIIKRQILNCKKNGSEKQCALFFTIEKGTAFLAGQDGSTLWTNAHLVSRFLKLRAALAKKSVIDLLETDGRVAIFLFDQDGKLAFDPFEHYATVTTYDGQPSMVSMLRGDWYAEDSDFVGIKLGLEIGVPLKIGPAPSAGQLLFRPGFAGCTGCPKNPNQTDPLLNKDRGEGKNSIGQGMYWTAGRLQSVDSINSFLGTNGVLSMFKIDQMIFFSADSQVGFSGGPILNETGEVVGIFAGSKPRMYEKDMVVLSRGVRPPIFNRSK